LSEQLREIFFTYYCKIHNLNLTDSDKNLPAFLFGTKDTDPVQNAQNPEAESIDKIFPI